VRGSGGRSGASSRTFNQEIFEKEFAFAGVERTAAAKARHITLVRWPWQGFKSNNFVLCRADGAMEQRCYRFHTHPRICDVRGHWRTGTPEAIQHRSALVWETMQLGLRSGPGSHTLVCGELPAQRLGRMSRLWNSKPPTAHFLGSPPLIGVLD
jgi:hypothetical protein